MYHVGGPFQCLNEDLSCQNGGSCQIENGQPVCVCLEGFSGTTCQFSTTTDGSWSTNMTGSPNYVNLFCTTGVITHFGWIERFNNLVFINIRMLGIPVLLWRQELFRSKKMV